MQPCDRCLENVWKFEHVDDGFIRAICQMCAHEVEWQGKKRRALTEADNPDNKIPRFIWTVVNGKHYRNGIEMIISQDRKGTVGYVAISKSYKPAPPPKLKSYLKDY